MPKGKRKSKVREEKIAKKLVQKTSSEKNFEELFEAIEKNDVELVKKIIEEEEIDINGHDKYGNTALHFAAEKNNLELLKLFVDKHEGDVNTVDEYNWSVLHSAASGIIHEREDWSIIEWMLEKGAKTYLKTTEGFTIENVFLQKDWSYAEKYKEIVANFMKKKESSDTVETMEETELSESQTEMEIKEIRTQIEVLPSS
jgi:hypothetical protein